MGCKKINYYNEKDSVGLNSAIYIQYSEKVKSKFNFEPLALHSLRPARAGNIYYMKDALGSVTDVADGSGNVIQRYNYASFGKIESIKDGFGNDITASPVVNTSYTYTGRESEVELPGTYYYRARYYDSNIGRFIQEDPYAGEVKLPITVVNKYVYVGNSPIMRKDPSGNFFLLDDLLIIGAIIGSLDAMANGQNIIIGALKGALVAAVLFYTYELVPPTNPFNIFAEASKDFSFAMATASSVIKAGTNGGSFISNFGNNVINGDTFVSAAFMWMHAIAVDQMYTTGAGGGTLDRFLIKTGQLGMELFFMAFPVLDYCSQKSEKGDANCKQ